MWADNENSIRLIRQVGSSNQVGYLIDTLLNPPTVKVAGPGQLQIRCLAPGSSGLQYVGTADNISPRVSLGSGSTSFPFDGTQQTVFTSAAQTATFTGLGWYQFKCQLQITNTDATTDYAPYSVQTAWQWSEDNNTWNSFTKPSSFVVVSGVTDVDFHSNELVLGAGTPPCLSSGNVWFRLVVTGKKFNSGSICMNNAYLLQLR